MTSSRFNISPAVVALLVLVAYGGCASYPSATGQFVGPVMPYRMRQANGVERTAFVITVEEGPPLRVPGSKRGLEEPTTGRRYFLGTKQGELYALDPNLSGARLQIRGTIRPGPVKPYAMGSLENMRLPDWGIEVRRVEPVDE